MTDLIHQASDNQIALAICFGAVAFCGLIMHFSGYVGQLTGRVRLHASSKDAAQTARRNQTASRIPPVVREKAA